MRTNDGNIFVMFMPPNVTLLIQPMDQNVLRLTKFYYRNSLLSCIVAGDDPVGISLKKITLRDAIIHLAAAWDKLNPHVISKCWHNIMVNVNAETDQEQLDEDDLPLSVLQQRLNQNRVVDIALEDTIALLQAIEPFVFKVTGRIHASRRRRMEQRYSYN